MATTRALLLTDVVDSTRRVAELGDAGAAALWARHDRLARDLLDAHGGREIDKTDGFLLLFDDVPDAVAYALAYHDGLRELGVLARAGIHHGPVVLTANDPEDVARGAKPLEVDGLAKPVAARIMSVATGGQTLLSQAARDRLGDIEERVVNHGHWRLKGVDEPVLLFEVGTSSAPFRPPPDGEKAWRMVLRGDHWTAAGELPRSLPRERDAFVGRRADLRALADRLEAGASLVSVLGIGGTGKTRLVTRYGWTWLGDYPGGVWFCDLSETRDETDVAGAVAQVLDVPLKTGDPTGAVGRAIASLGPCLLVLDNFEQVARHADATVGRWLDLAPEARFVVTTREVLGLPGETALALPPLTHDDAVELFEARAAQARRGFVVTAELRPDVQRLVELLDRLPLAIELAASRARVMPPATLLSRMERRFDLLTSGRGRRDRQATLRGTLDWSWDLLEPEEQAGLAQLSVFEGGFDLEAAEAVLDVGDAWAVDLVQALIDKSLVRQVDDDRFDLLVSVQAYARERLVEQDAVEAAETRHGAYLAETLGSDDAIDALHLRGGMDRLRRLTLERDNLRAACRRAVDRGDADVATGTLRALLAVTSFYGPADEGRPLAEAVAALPGLTAEQRAWVLRGLAATQRSLSDLRIPAATLRDALTAAEASGNPRLQAMVRSTLAYALQQLDDFDGAQQLYEQAMALIERSGDRPHLGRILNDIALIDIRRGRYEAAAARLERAVAIDAEVGDERCEVIARSNLAYVMGLTGSHEEGRRQLEHAVASARKLGYRPLEASLLGNLGQRLLVSGPLDEARRCLEGSMALARRIGEAIVEMRARSGLGRLAYLEGDLERANHTLTEIVEAVTDSRTRGTALVARARVRRDRQDLPAAIEDLDAAALLFEQDRDMRAVVEVVRGTVLYRGGDPEAALTCLDHAVAELRDLDASEQLASALAERIVLDRAAGRDERAAEGLAELEDVLARLELGPTAPLRQRLDELSA